MYQQQYQPGGYAPQNQGGYAPQNQNVYVGRAKFQQGQYGLMVSISLNAEDIAKLQANLNQNGWVTFSLRERQQPSQSGATHYGVIRPPMPPQQGNANWNGPVGQVGPVGQRGNQWNGARGQGYQQGGYQQRPQGANWNGPVGQVGPVGQRGNQWNGARGQGYQQPAPPPQQGYDNGGFNQGPAPAQQYQQPAPAAPGNEHRYGPADAQPPAADDGQDPSLDNGMPM